MSWLEKLDNIPYVYARTCRLCACSYYYILPTTKTWTHCSTTNFDLNFLSPRLVAILITTGFLFFIQEESYSIYGKKSHNPTFWDVKTQNGSSDTICHHFSVRALIKRCHCSAPACINTTIVPLHSKTQYRDVDYGAHRTIQVMSIEKRASSKGDYRKTSKLSNTKSTAVIGV